MISEAAERLARLEDENAWIREHLKMCEPLEDPVMLVPAEARPALPALVARRQWGREARAALDMVSRVPGVLLIPIFEGLVIGVKILFRPPAWLVWTAVAVFYLFLFFYGFGVGR